jgi:hypothetical protein
MRGVAATVFLLANTAAAQVTPGSPPPAEPQVDGAERADTKDGKKEPARKVPFRGSTLALDNSASAQTLGIGSDYQSRNPSYEIALGVRARYLLWEQPEERSVSVAAALALVHEFTDSDSTTERGEWTFTDLELLLAFNQRLAGGQGYKTDLLLGVPVLSFPTSQVSANNGKILGAGISAALAQTLPLREDQGFLPSARGRIRLGYNYQFTRAVVPTNEGIERIRLDPLGRSVPSDQLSGAAFSQHQGTLALAAGLDITSFITWDVELGWRPAYKYDLGDEVVLGNVDTGDVELESADDATRFTVTTLFQTEIVVDVPRPLAFSVGYENVTLQLGEGGERRNMLYSPDARFFASVILHLDQFYDDFGDAEPLPPALARR